MNIEARFVCRPTDAANANGDLLLGAMFKSQSGLLKANTIYEIVSVMNELMIREVGPCLLTLDGASRQLLGASWSNSYVDIPQYTAGRYLATADELAEVE